MIIRRRRFTFGAGALAAALAVAGAEAPAGAVTPASAFKVPCDKVARAGRPLVRGFNCRTIKIQGYPRRYVVYVPRTRAFRPTKKAPVVFGFHGSDGSGGNFLKTSGWVRRAERERILLVFGTALKVSVIAEGGHIETRWNTYEQVNQIDPDVKPPNYPASADWPADDIGFVRAMLHDVSRTAKVDRKRVFATGFSNGAVFTTRVGIDLADRFAAISGFGGSLLTAAEASDPIPYLLVFGAHDHLLADASALPVPLDPASWDAYPVWLRRIAATTQTWGAAERPERIVRAATHTRLDWDVGKVPLRIGLLGDVSHEYPGSAIRISWMFFEDNRK